MSEIELYKRVMSQVEPRFHQLAQRVPAPVMTDMGHGPVWRYAEQTAQQAVLQKAARVVSGLNAGILLLEAGYVQELAM